MPRLRLTKAAIDALPIAAKDTVYWDAGLPGFGVKITPQGRKVFIVLYRTAGAGSRLRKYTIGPYGRITLAMARAHAQKIFVARLEGRDPAMEKREARRRVVIDGVDELVEAYIQERVVPLRTAKKVASRLRRDVLPRWGTKSVHDIKRRDVIDLVGEVAQRGAGTARKLLKSLKTFFRWCVSRAVIDFSPAEGITAPGKEVARDRVLTDNELVAVLRSARQMSWPFTGIVELLAHTGQRREEVAQMTWDEIDREAATWCIPATRAKNGRAHLVHLSDQAQSVIERANRGGSAYVFATAGLKRFQDFTDAKKELDRRSGVTDWRLHDLRRTVVSGMARIGIPPHVADKILNHRSGTISGVAAVYQRYEFLAERQRALEHWSAHVEKILEAAQPKQTLRIIAN